MFRDDSNQAWERYGRDDPYYGVLSGEEYRRANLTDDAKRRFLDTGERDVARAIGLLERRFGAIDPEGHVVDFGCGVGRLVIPFARRFARVTGIDVSPSMIAEARRNCAAAGIGNAAFVASPEGLSGAALVHSFIVFQHIPPRFGEALFDQLVGALRPGGVGALHVTFARRAPFSRKLVHWLRANFVFLNPLVNLLQGKRAGEPLIQMNNYDLGRLMGLLTDRGITEVGLELAEVQGQYSAFILFRRPA